MPSGFVGKQRPDYTPFEMGHIISAHSGAESGFAAQEERAIFWPMSSKSEAQTSGQIIDRVDFADRAGRIVLYDWMAKAMKAGPDLMRIDVRGNILCKASPPTEGRARLLLSHAVGRSSAHRKYVKRLSRQR